MNIVILTGYSGAGKSSALRYVEEHGYYCVDNLPAQLLTDLVAIAAKRHMRKVAVVIDARGSGFMEGLDAQVDALQVKHRVRVIFCESDLAAITKRFKEHRLRHPLALSGTIADGFAIEKKLLSGLRHRADLVVNTSSLDVHALKSLIKRYIAGRERGHFEVCLMSFGFKYGLPQEADFVIDARLLVNPFFEPGLKNKTGKNLAVARFIRKNELTAPFLKTTAAYLQYVLGVHREKGRAFVSVAIGCTGGKHRSVFVVEALKKVLQARDRKVVVRHRDIAAE